MNVRPHAAMTKAILLVGFSAALLAGCGGVHVPAPGGSGRVAPAQSPVAQPVDVPAVVVRRGDTLYGIARRNDVPVRGLIVLNRLDPPYRLSAGQQLLLPPQARLHTVVQGDTAYSIARRYGVTVGDLAQLNALDPPGRVLLGQQLVIPGPELQTRVVRAPDQTRAATAAAEYAVETEALPPPAPSTPPGTAAGAPSQTAGVVDRSSPAAPATVKDSGSSRFMMPVEGRILSGYGPKSGGLQNDGLNIAAPRGTSVHAADDGVVVYAGNELPGFGNLVLVKHADGWVTAYGHNETIAVKRGESVRRGQPIATVGSTGNVTEPQLHFELRQGSRAVDPSPYLTAGA